MKKLICCKIFIPLFTYMVFSQGLPGEFKTSNRYRALGTETSPLVNPSLIAENDYSSVHYILSSFLREFYYHDFRFTTPVTLNHSLGLTWMNYGPSAYDLMEFDETGFESEAVGTVVDQSHLFTLTYGGNILYPLQYGVNVNLLYHRFADEKYKSIGLDVGLAYRFAAKRAGAHVLGCALHNAVAPVSGIPFSRVLAISWHGTPFNGPIFGAVDLQIKDIIASSEDNTEGAPCKWEINSKLGFSLFKILSISALAGFSRDGLGYIGAATGLNASPFSKGRDISAGAQHLYLDEKVALQSIQIQGEFGKGRIDAHKKRMARLREEVPLQLLEKGKRLYHEEKYWEAYITLAQIQNEYPHFRRMDQVQYYSAASLEMMSMYSPAETIYSEARKSYSGSDYLISYNLGLLRIAYRKKNVSDMVEAYENMTQAEASDSVMLHASYLMGEMYLQRKKYEKARKFLTAVTLQHPDYPFALYSLAMSQYHQNKHDEAVKTLQILSGYKSDIPAVKEIVNRANLLMGTIYMEELRYSHKAMRYAIISLRRVEESSIYYPEALVVNGWLAVRVGQWDDCLNVGEKLMNANARNLLRSEGALVAGIAHYMNKEYRRAIDILNEGIVLIEKESLIQEPQENRLSRKELVMQMENVGERLVRMAGEGLKQKTERNLYRKYQQYSKLLDENFKKTDQGSFDKSLTERAEQLYSDITFLIADATRKMHFEPDFSAENEEIESIDRQLEQLRRKVKVLEKEN